MGESFLARPPQHDAFGRNRVAFWPAEAVGFKLSRLIFRSGHTVSFTIEIDANDLKCLHTEQEKPTAKMAATDASANSLLGKWQTQVVQRQGQLAKSQIRVDKRLLYELARERIPRSFYDAFRVTRGIKRAASRCVFVLCFRFVDRLRHLYFSANAFFLHTKECFRQKLITSIMTLFEHVQLYCIFDQTKVQHA